MDETKIYKCPGCGSVLAYDAETDRMTCSQCQNTYTTAQAEAENNRLDSLTFQDAVHTAEDQAFGESVNAFTCSACGAQMMTDANTAAQFCSFCGSPNVIPSRLSGVYRPAYVLPFKISRQQAEDSFRKWAHNGKFTPKDFALVQEMEKLTGIYVPFWLFNCSADGAMSAVGTKVSSYRQGDYRYTTTRYYSVRRRAMMEYVRVPADGSSEMSNETMDLLEPFDYSAMEPFELPYLSGYLAQKYDETASAVFPRIRTRLDEYTRKQMRETVFGYSSVTNINYMGQYPDSNAEYVLLPVWFHRYRYNGKVYEFAMNGQTGKIIGKPPVSAGRVAFQAVLTAAAAAAVMFAGGLLLI